ncbi:MAG: hypothetical protein WCX64_02760 [Candidatus Micrarchaeia archaeon]|jgi:hypothetical protein
MASQPRNARAAQAADVDDVGEDKDGVVAKYTYLAMAVFIFASIVLMFLRFVLYLW